MHDHKVVVKACLDAIIRETWILDTKGEPARGAVYC
jgi:hypothetical protein